MTTQENETEVMQLMEPYIRNYCKWKWTAIEMDDRLSEARYVFLIVLRTRRIPEDQIWTVFQRTLDEHMRPINAAEGWHRFHCRSLDARIQTHRGEEGSHLLDMIASPQPDPCAIITTFFDQNT